jgi:hypothetical protein
MTDRLVAFERALYGEPVAWFCEIADRAGFISQMKGLSPINGLLLIVTLYGTPGRRSGEDARQISIALYDADGSFMLDANFALVSYERALRFVEQLMTEEFVIEVHQADAKTSIMPAAIDLYGKLTESAGDTKSD